MGGQDWRVARSRISMRATIYRSIDVDGLSIFYREAGDPDAPTLLLLHGFPSSSRMYEPLFTRLAETIHLVAPDYPGFGHSDAPDPKGFAYPFDNLARIIGRFTELLRLERYSLFVQDYGGPVGFRLALAHPDRLTALVVQNAVAHEDGLGPLWQTRRNFWADRSSNETALRANFLSFDATRLRHVGTSLNVSLYDPDLWTDEFAFLSRPGQGDIQMDLFYDYRTNVASYPAWQKWLRRHQPPLLVLWDPFRPVVPGRRSRGIPARRAQCRSAHSRCRPFRTRRAARQGRAPDSGIPSLCRRLGRTSCQRAVSGFQVEFKSVSQRWNLSGKAHLGRVVEDLLCQPATASKSSGLGSLCMPDR